MAIISKATVLQITEYGKDIKEYILKLDKNNYFEPGSFLLLSLEKKEDYTKWPESRNFSIASVYNEAAHIRLIIRRIGVYTERIFNELTLGAVCVVKYAFGDFLLPFYDVKSPICCIGGGTGIAPILSFVEELKNKGQEARLHVYYSFKDRKESMGVDILREIVPPNQLYLYSTREYLPDIINRRIGEEDILKSSLNFNTTHFYICGSETFTDYFRSILLREGAENIYTDEW
ncbi:FAD-dependent oxidoreductase [Dysgonomonas sp. Marseille-P4677]|uniref:FAD-dependent oxidoreductase n=1 Tax=Dysgonomonas sp. Marseille-P4677 TaxID=2364790 RepID=UPI00191380CE|nr:FAD-dependent oxidoreductase [Dysgonomonas sp. Marseille-P4677]MBK5719457.1 FAD-dependent oxidoreductase [Dysgonomonas sp. Marseille-P4677]